MPWWRIWRTSFRLKSRCRQRINWWRKKKSSMKSTKLKVTSLWTSSRVSDSRNALKHITKSFLYLQTKYYIRSSHFRTIIGCFLQQKFIVVLDFFQKEEKSCFCSSLCLFSLAEVRLHKYWRLIIVDFAESLIIFEYCFHLRKHLRLVQLSQSKKEFFEHFEAMSCFRPDSVNIWVAYSIGLSLFEFNWHIGILISFTADIKSLSGSKIDDCKVERRIFLWYFCNFLKFWFNKRVSLIPIFRRYKLTFKKTIDKFPSGKSVSNGFYIKISEENQNSCLYVDSQPRSPWNNIATCIDVLVIFILMKTKGLSVSLFFSVEAQYDLNGFIGAWFNTYAHEY